MKNTEYYINTDKAYQGEDVPKKYILFIGDDFEFDWPSSIISKVEKESVFNEEDKKFLVQSFNHVLLVNHLYHCRNLFDFFNKKLECFNYIGSAFKKLILKKFRQSKKYANKKNILAKHQQKVFNLHYAEKEIVQEENEKYPKMVCFELISFSDNSKYYNNSFQPKAFKVLNNLKEEDFKKMLSELQQKMDKKNQKDVLVCILYNLRI